jgi:hypothetical protein
LEGGGDAVCGGERPEDRTEAREIHFGV